MVQAEQSDGLKTISGSVTYGWDRIPVRVRLGSTEWKSSLFSKDGRYIVPFKVSIRRADNLREGETVAVQFEIG